MKLEKGLDEARASSIFKGQEKPVKRQTSCSEWQEENQGKEGSILRRISQCGSHWGLPLKPYQEQHKWNLLSSVISWTLNARKAMLCNHQTPITLAVVPESKPCCVNENWFHLTCFQHSNPAEEEKTGNLNLLILFDPRVKTRKGVIICS